ncbi:MAG: hypothetical protein UX99_C0009G0012 [Candidatus Amesbacteria bacterium GW2011_GWB1_47_26]|uniref:LTD domain-containing protein n=1 Tax=Candidatus Amesbacteria bacterium GW2011_GWC2_45_19 TaxID=1618366 RepID=A0A0G1PDE6_9BACT|nr:MAG: hypothetical protein UX05_C0001G0082 [Candidatus Amesbacteria bacterium GW2011_GWC2_45_19]KKU38159.1 MAG: hypothetical protein UX52_C0010G0011 [Candidatus Amesbacteria bacterium GW2011_GWA1_46_35]KKU69564.1 MAG: hypothetical protein UX93_C0001G0149 [Microgenomates group bacterium GW2011_GWC1_47_20]KKU74646.1 MAG: hypothetical protein UX99_C0009G0012 [Candidatus Amesbacteria bacterium GW2011_GWB1_47_26]
MKWWGIALLPFFFCPLKIYASIGINEFQVEPSGSSQWIELYNSGPDSQDISGWFIDDDGGTTKFTIPTNTVLTPNACMSFQSGSFFWNTASGDKARLLSGDTIIDEYQYSSSPGNNVSFGRLPDGTGGWTTFSNPSRDKLNNTNTSCLSLPTPSPSSTPLSTPLQTPAVSPTPTPNDYSNLSISEYLPYPDSGNEWVEIYNGNDSEVNLYGWFVDDVADGGSAPIGISGTISAKTYKQFYLSDSFLNNSGDDVRLLNGSKIEKNKTSFSASTKAKSWSKDSSGNWCQIDPTPNSSNPSCPTLTSAPSPSASTGTNTPKPSPTPKSSSTPTSTPTAKPSPTPSISPPTLPPLTLRGGTEESDIKETPTVLSSSTQRNINFPAIALIAVGGIVFIASVGLIIRGYVHPPPD